ncbi:ABC transporter permease [Bacillus horti]|uniref:ABC-2 type transport system permease protein n=1 Tax=Caldalkalibacillus horti TaxID=77523 RepID=A0ABT9VVL2_9BACI|nr:ABC transporter permease [Bacillus horti]MDQ0165011.1 ABC-2 type transport system permease protein [Bacillus horti]
MNMLWVQSRAEIIRLFRSKIYIIMSLLLPIMFYYIFTNIFNTGTEADQGWGAFYLMSMATFSVMGSAIFSLGIRNVQERTQGFATLMKTTPLPSSFYFLAKMIGQTVVHIFSVVVIFVAGYLINDVSLTPMEWITSGLWIIFGSITFLGLGTLIGTMKRVDTASGVSNFIYLGLALLGGMWMPAEVLPEFLQNIGQMLPSYHFRSGSWSLAAGDLPELTNVLFLLGYLVLFMLLSTYISKRQEAV